MASDAVQQIKERISILDIVAPYVELHKAGKSYKGKSPFTSEKTPSFHVSPDRGMYYCFSTSQGGDMFTFVQIMEGVDFKGALKILAEKAGVELVPEDPKKRSQRDTQYVLMEEATKFYEEWGTKMKNVSAYLEKRGVKKITASAWRIGYAPGPPHNGWRHAREYLQSKGFSDEQMIQAGLIKATDGGKAPYDVFRDRIMFPIFDSSGRVVAFSGRILETDSEAPKYVNSPETELFNKSEILFGFDRAKQGIRKYDFSLIVEGQFDVVLSHQGGYTNAVAVSGTAMTAHHASLLQRLSDRVVLALDADRAGIAAVKRAAELMLARGMDVKVARLPQGSDPADIILKEPKLFKDVIGHATHVIEFLLAILKEEVQDTRGYKLRVRDEVVPYLLRIESRIDRDHFEGVIAEALQTTKDSIHLEVSRLERERESRDTHISSETTIGTDPSDKKDVSESRLERLTNYLVIVREILDERTKTILENNLVKIMNTSVDVVREKMPPESVSPLLFNLEKEFAEMNQKAIQQELASKLQELKELSLKVLIREKQVQLTEAEQTHDEEIVEKSLQEIANLQKEFTQPVITEEVFLSKS
ncbi:MAG: DNA primase, partial [Candidatus Paceibacterota bacterium]